MTLKQPTGYWIPIVVWAFCAYLLGDSLVRGAWTVALSGLPWLLLVSAVIYALLWRPALIIGTNEATIRNPLVSYDLPFADIVDVRIGPTVSVQVHDKTGRVHRLVSWNAPGAPRRPKDRGDGRESDSQILQDRWNASEPARVPGPVSRQVNVLPLAIVGLALVWCIVSVAM